MKRLLQSNFFSQHQPLTTCLGIFWVFLLISTSGFSQGGNSCATLTCDGYACDDGSNADGVQTSRRCGCGEEISGACAEVVIDLSQHPAYVEGGTGYLDFSTQESGNFTIYFTDDQYSVNDCSQPDFDVSSGTIFQVPTGQALIYLMACKNGGNAGRRDLSFSYRTDDGSGDESVSSARDGGLESNNRLAEKVTRRNFHRALENTSQDYMPTSLERFFKSDTYGDRRSTLLRGEYSLEDFIPVDAIANTQTYLNSPSDLIDITNATEIIGVDIFRNDERIGAMFTTQSTEGVYEHTKFICDRLQGSWIDRVLKVLMGAEEPLPFIVSKLVNPDGSSEFSTNFSVRQEGAGFALESHWNLTSYPSDVDYLNFQIWAGSLNDLISLVNETLFLLQQKAPILQYNMGDSPRLYVRKAHYSQGQIEFEFNNQNLVQEVEVIGLRTLSETEETDSFSQTIELAGESREEYTLETGNLYDFSASFHYETGAPVDAVYLADGAWGLDYENQHTTVDRYQVSPGNHPADPEKYYVERDVEVEGVTDKEVVLFRALNPTFRPVNLSTYNTLTFEASGRGNLEITLVKSQIQDWDQQMKTSVRLDTEPQQIDVSLDQFQIGYGELDWSDITSIVFKWIGDSNEREAFHLEVSNVAFSNTLGLDIEGPLTATSHTIFPNPVVHAATVMFTVPYTQPYQFQLLDVSGRVLKKISGVSSQGVNEIALKNEGYANGLYFYNIIVNQTLMTGRFVLQR